MSHSIDDYFDKYFSAYRNNDAKKKKNVLGHANEINATRLGYGRGDNGTGNTVNGLLDKFKELEKLSCVKTFSEAVDLVIFVEDFAEDGLSDLITNVIQKDLYDNTDSIFKKYKMESSRTCRGDLFAMSVVE